MHQNLQISVSALLYDESLLDAQPAEKTVLHTSLLFMHTHDLCLPR